MGVTWLELKAHASHWALLLLLIFFPSNFGLRTDDSSPLFFIYLFIFKKLSKQKVV